MVHGNNTRDRGDSCPGRRTGFDHGPLDMLHPAPGGVQAPRFRNSSRRICSQMAGEIRDLVAAHEVELRDAEIMWENSLRDVEIMWQDRLEITVSELSDHNAESKVKELERELKMAQEESKADKDQLEKLQEQNNAKQQQLDKFQDLWGSIVDTVVHQVSSMSSSQGPKERECSVCFATTSQAAISGHNLGVFYCHRGCPNVVCDGCMGEKAFSRRCLYCRTGPLQGPPRLAGAQDDQQEIYYGSTSPPTSPRHDGYSSPTFSPTSPAYTPTSLMYDPDIYSPE